MSTVQHTKYAEWQTGKKIYELRMPIATGPGETTLAAMSVPLEMTAAHPSIAMVLATYLPESYGGAEQQSRKLALALSRLGSRVSILAPKLQASTPQRERDGPIFVWRFRVNWAPNLGGRHMGSALLWALKLSWWMLRHRREYQIVQVIHGRLHAVPAVIAAWLLGKPTVVKIGRGGSEHFDLDVVQRKRYLGHWYARILVHHTDAFVANSQEIVDDLQRWRMPVDRIYHIPNGVDVAEDFLPGSSDVVRFVYLGRLDQEKAIDIMLRGFARLQDRSRASLRIVGDGACSGELKSLCDQLQLNNCVRFEGAIEDVSSVLMHSDVFVSTSLSEGMSNALLEAMSYGVMPLVSKVSGTSEIVEDGQSGLLFAPGDVEAFVFKLQQALDLTEDARRAFATQARATVAERFGIDRVAKSHIALYRDLLKRASSSRARAD
jgi:glycosyltransferase involved in cell wall biosynthesis